MGLLDKIIGAAVGTLTNLTNPAVSYAVRSAVGNIVNDANDYNQALGNADMAALGVGALMTAGGGTAAAAGLTAAAAGGAVSLSGVGAVVGVPEATGALVVAGAGAATAAGGAILMSNASANAAAGYNYGEESSGTKSDNKLKPSSEATGDHSSFKTDADGNITNTATYKQNPQNPSGFDEVKRVDVTGKAHNGVETPHVHEPKKPVRPAKPEDLPKQK